MKWRSLFPAYLLSALLGVTTPSAADEVLDKALKVLSKGWSGTGGTEVLHYPDGKARAELSFWILQCESRPYFFIAAVDQSSDSSDSGPLAEGAFQAKDKQVVRWSCETLDGKTGAVEVGGRKFKLEDGAAFWVFRRGERWQVYQTKVDPDLLQQESKAQFAGTSFRLLAAVAKSEKALAEYAQSLNLKVE